jgi:hypothetical protein
MEGSGNYGGMCASQRPEAIGQWLEGAYRCKNGFQVSADLDDYNWQHEMWELEQVWWSRAEAYWGCNSTRETERGNSASLIAAGFARSVVVNNSYAFRVFLGLYSGHRGTTWDNTSIHEIGRQIAIDVLCRLGLRTTHHNPSESGDDEWFWVDTWKEAAAYIQTCKMMGLRMNSKKQLVGTKHGESTEMH